MITSIDRPQGRTAAPHRRRTHLLAAAGLGLLAACSGGQQSLPDSGDDVVASYGGFGVTSGTVFEINGPVGGPFPQGERTYRLENFGTTLLAWELETSVPWLNSSATGGAISPGVDTEVTISIDQDQAALLPAGTYPADIVFRDRGDLDGTVYLAFVLQVLESGAGAELAVGPAGAFDMYGIDGGSLSPTQKSYMLTNVGSDPLSWNVQLDAGWVDADVWAGDLDPGESTSVQLTADAAQVLALGVGQHTTLAHFINTTNDAGTTQRPVRATIDPLQGTGDRVTDGLVSLYDFEAGGGTLVQDLGGSGLDLTVQDPGAVQWIPGALRLASPTFVSTSGPATALTSLVQASDELTVEAWLRPANVSQDGPARIVTLSGGTLERNFTLGQGLWGSLASDSFNLRLRTSTTDLDGMPLQDTGGGWATTELTHVVATRDSAGNETIYVNGQVAKSAVVGGVLDGWDASFVLGLGNEVGGGRPWLGDLHLVALYDRALSDAEVQQNLDAGPQDADSSLLSVSPAGTFQVSGVLNAALSATSTTYTLSNDGSAALDWGVTQDVSWFTLQGPLSGTLFPGDTVDLVCDLDPAAIFSLGTGTHQGTIEFTNLTDGLGNTSRGVAVTVQDDNSGGNNGGGNNGGSGGGWDPANHPTLTPGSGWSGGTNQPGQVGSGFAADRMTVARWDVVQSMDVSEPAGLGVLAFHTNGIQKVTMAVDGGPWVELTLMEPNPRTGVAEYWAVLDPSLFSVNKLSEVRAIAYPNAGRPRLLDSLWVNVLPNPTSDGVAYVSNGGSDSGGNGTASSPFATITKAAQHLQSVGGGKADGGTILLTAGDHTIGDSPVTTQHRYLTITHAPGATRANTRIVGHVGYGLDTKRLRLKDLTIRTYMDTTAYVGNFLWLDGCHQKGNGQYATSGPGTSSTWLPANFPWNWMGMTDCEVSDARFGPTMSYFQRGTYIHHIAEDVFRYPACLIDVDIEHVHPGTTGWHSDLLEISGGFTQENMVVYNVEATDVNAQGVFVKAPGGQTTTLRDSAFVNFVIHKTDNVWASQFASNSSVSNVLFWNCTFANMALGIRSPGVTNLDFQSSVLSNVYSSDGGVLQDGWFEDCHFISGNALGSGASSGNPSNLFQNAGALDFSPGAGSPLLDRTTVQVPYDLNGVLRSLPGNIGALEE